MKRFLPCLSLLVIGFPVLGCSHLMSLGSIKADMSKPEFRAQIEPLRDVRVLILANEPDPGLESLIQEASQEMEQQVGIRLKPIGYAPIRKRYSFGTRGVLRTLREAAEDSRTGYDIAISTWGVMGMDVMAPLGILMLGVTDDTYRRYIVLRVKTKFILLHEIYHTFIFNEAHGGCVMMSGFWPVGSGCVWLTPENWKEVMKNKCRDFAKKPEIPDEAKWDVISAQ